MYSYFGLLAEVLNFCFLKKQKITPLIQAVLNCKLNFLLRLYTNT